MTTNTQKPINQRSDALNRNTGKSGNNKTYAHTNGNRGKQLNSNAYSY